MSNNSTTEQPARFLYGVEDLPKEVYDFKRTMTKRYREAVCEHFNLQCKQIEGDGNCFFASCAAAFMYVSHLLRPDGKEIDYSKIDLARRTNRSVRELA
jgi:hypothetical protein